MNVKCHEFDVTHTTLHYFFYQIKCFNYYYRNKNKAMIIWLCRSDACWSQTFPFKPGLLSNVLLILCSLSRTHISDWQQGKQLRTMASLSVSQHLFDVAQMSEFGGVRSVVASSALAQATSPVGPVSPVTNRRWHLWAGGLCDTATGDGGLAVNGMNIHHRALFHPISPTPAVPCPPIETERGRRKCDDDVQWESGPRRK